MLLWLWPRPAAAARVRPPAWELPHAAGAAFKKKKSDLKQLLTFGSMGMWQVGAALCQAQVGQAWLQAMG